MKGYDPKIITFYSYKGGVGRSMALANTAYLLAKEHNYKVIIVDWDFEAPGLHRYFQIPRENIKKGLIDIFYDFKEVLRNKNSIFDEKLIDIDEYIQSIPEKLTSGSISILPAGKLDKAYSAKVNGFDWNDFYKNWHGYGFIEFLKKQLKTRADFILIDSRTGLSDIGGICTLQLPDIVLLFFSFNEQSLHGTKFICDNISNNFSKPDTKDKTPKIILIPSRIEVYLEHDLLQEWEIIATRILEQYLPKNENNLYINKMAIPYIAYYSFGEKIAVKIDRYGKVSESFEKITKLILEFSSIMDASSQLEARILDAITIQEPELRNKILLEMVSELKDEITSSDLARSILKIALDEVKSSANDELKAKTLKEIAFNIHLVDIDEFLNAVKGVKDENQKANILVSITSELLESNAMELLNTIKSITNENLKSDLLIRLINGEDNYYKKESVIEEILDLTAEIQDENCKMRLYIELLPSQTLSVRIILIKEILNKLDTIKDPDLIFKYLVQIISSLKSSVEKDFVAEFLKKLLPIGDSYLRRKVICMLAEINLENSILSLLETLKKEKYSVTMTTEALKIAFQHIPDKQKAWNDLYRFINDEDSDVRYAAAFALGFSFAYVPDKQKAWNDLYRLTSDEDRDMRSAAVSALGSSFPYVPDKQQAWNDLHRLINDNNYWRIRISAASALGSSFPYIPDKQKAWNELYKLTNDEDTDVRSAAASALGSSFSYIPDKQKAWNNLHRLTNDKDDLTRYSAASALGSSFSYVPDKQKAWNDLHRLTSDEDTDVRSAAASALGSSFSYIPDKQKAWNDLHRLTNDEHINVRSAAASALGSSFPYVPNKQEAWNDLHRLTSCYDRSIRAYANHSLGKISIFKASQAEREEDYKQELKNAIKFFEIATQEDKLNGPSKFCLPFYRSLYTIIFKKYDEKEEIDKYLAEAKDAIGNSKEKKLLFEAVNNLANALKEVKNLKNLDLEKKRNELNFYRKYCDNAEKIMSDAEEVAPFAIVTIKKGLPILDQNLKELFEEIQSKAKITCKKAKGTNTEKIAYAVGEEIKTWKIGDQEEMTSLVENLIFTLESNIPKMPENKHIFEKIEQIREQKDLSKQYVTISTIISLIPKISLSQRIDSLELKISGICEETKELATSSKQESMKKL